MSDIRQEGKTCPPCSSAPSEQLPAPSAVPAAPLPQPSDAPLSAPKAPQTAPVYAAPLPQKPPFRLQKGEGIAFLLCALAGFAYVFLFLFSHDFIWDLTRELNAALHLNIRSNLAFAVFTACFVAAFELGCRACRRPANRESGFWLAVTLALAFGQSFLGNTSLQGWPWLLVHLSAAHWALCRCGGAEQQLTGALVWLDLLRTWFGLPFANLFRGFWFLKRPSGRKSSPGRHPVLFAALGVLLMLPVVVWAFGTLVRADAAFANLTESLYRLLPAIRLDGMLVGKVCFSLFFTCYFFGLFCGAARLKNNTDRITTKEIYTAADNMRLLPAITIGTALAFLCGLYLLFFASGLDYLFAAFVGRLPEAYTAAEYARRGFFELCSVAAVDLLVLAVAAKCSRAPLRTVPALKTLAAALCGANLLFGVIAASKLGLYIARFGLTGQRVLAAYAIFVLLAWSALALASVLRPIAAIPLAIKIAAVAFALLCVCNIDGIIKSSRRVPAAETLIASSEPNGYLQNNMD